MKALVLTAALLAIAGLPAQAEVIKVPVGSQMQDQQQISRPSLGMHKDDVEKEYGEPQNWTEPKGEPPISRWEYADFVVYFESDYVIHSVIKHRRADQ